MSELTDAYAIRVEELEEALRFEKHMRRTMQKYLGDAYEELADLRSRKSFSDRELVAMREKIFQEAHKYCEVLEAANENYRRQIAGYEDEVEGLRGTGGIGG